MEPSKVFRRDLLDVGEAQSHKFEEFDRESPSPYNGRPSLSSRPAVKIKSYIFPEDRKLGYVSTALLIVNRMIGTGIFSTPSTIIRATNSTGATLLFWVLGGFMSLCGLLAYIELGTALPRSGGEKNYLERIYRRPKYWTTCIFAVQFICFMMSAANCVNFSSYLLLVITGLDNSGSKNCGRTVDGGLMPSEPIKDEWLNKGISIAAITVVCLVHAFAPKAGIWVSNALGCFKVIMLLVIICTGFAALAGNMNTEVPNNFSSFDGYGDACPQAPPSATSTAANFSIALMQVLYSYSGWESANYVLSEVRQPEKTLKWAAPIGAVTVTCLYILANIAYFAGSTKEQIANSGVTVAASFFSNVYGPGLFTTRILPAIISLSILGNIFGQTYCFSRVKQEIAKEGLIPFWSLFSSDWPLRTPTGGLLLHWIFTVVIILGPSTSDAYPFITNLGTYAQSLVKLLIGAGLTWMVVFDNRRNGNGNSNSSWVKEKKARKGFRTHPLLTVLWCLSLVYVLVAPFIPNDIITPSIRWFVVPAVGMSVVGIGTVYWVYWFKLWPMFGYAVEADIEVLPDGSERVRYSHVKYVSAF